MARYLIVDTASREIVNVVEWDGATPWTAPAGTVEIWDADRRLAIGGTLEADESYTPPPDPPTE